MNINNPLFSILLVHFNKADYIQATINSILKQTYQNFEIIIGDDCSSDNTEEIIKTINDKRIKYVKMPFNLGINNNLNTIAEIATGDYCVYLASDDLLRINYLEKIKNAFEQNKYVDAIYCQLAIIDEFGNYIESKDTPYYYAQNRTPEEFLHIAFMKHNILPSPGMAFRRSLKNKIFPQECSIVNFQDYKIHTDILITGHKNLVLDDILVDYRIFNNNRNISYRNTETIKREILETEFLLDTFLKIEDIEFLKQIFHKEIQQTKIIPYKETIPFFLGQMALLSRCETRKEWGYKTICRFLQNKNNFYLVFKYYNFSFKNFLELIKKINLNVPEMNKTNYNIKYLKYKKLYNIFLALSLFLLVMIFLIFLSGKLI